MRGRGERGSEKGRDGGGGRGTYSEIPFFILPFSLSFLFPEKEASERETDIFIFM